MNILRNIIAIAIWCFNHVHDSGWFILSNMFSSKYTLRNVLLSGMGSIDITIGHDIVRHDICLFGIVLHMFLDS